MVLKFFGINSTKYELENRSGKLPGKGLATIQIAIAASKSGLHAEFFTTSLGFNPSHHDIEFYKKYSDMTDSQVKKWNIEADKSGVLLNECELPFSEIIKKISNKCIPIILLDWNVIKGIENKYQGHFVPIVGFVNEKLLVHNPGQDGKSFLQINKDIFEKARKAKGTDQDIIFLSIPSNL